MKYLLWAVLIGFSITAHAEEPQGQGYGPGMKSCTQFANDYKANPGIAENLYLAWGEGFMSGLNLSATAANMPSRRLASINVESAKIQIRSYCDSHPLSQYVGAILAIYSALPMLPANSN